MRIANFPVIDSATVARAMGDREKTTLTDLHTIAQAFAEQLCWRWAEHLSPLARQYLGDSPVLIMGLTTVRNHVDASSHAPWHRDSGFFPPFGKGLTFWCPLQKVAPGIPGVEFKFPDGRQGVPVLGPGQCLVIPPDIEHRTEPVSGRRMSIEFRCAGAQALPSNLSPSGGIVLSRRQGDRVGFAMTTVGRAVENGEVSVLAARREGAEPAVVPY